MTLFRVVFLWAFACGTAMAEMDWSRYGAVLEAHVSGGEIDGITLNRVDYEAIAADPRFAQVVASVRQFDVRTLTSDQEKLAFYINAYNILTIQLIIDHYPLESIRDIGNFFKGPWDIVMLSNADGDLTLDDIEHKIIRSIPEPRIHFAVNCASVSCPDLRPEPYTSARLDAQLDEQTRAFLSEPRKGFRVQGDTAQISKIFRWYGDDFDAGGGVPTFIRRYVDTPFKDVRTSLDYDWRLNDAP